MYHDFADLYDRIYSDKDYEAESAQLAEIVTAHNPDATTLLDVACGTGGHLVHLQDRFECQGIDLSAEMIEVARAKLPDTTLHVGDMTEFDLGTRFDAVICMFSAVGHLKTVDRLDAAIARMAVHLAPRGILAVQPWIDPADWLVGNVHMDTYEDDEMKIARVSVAEPVDRGRVVMELLVGTKAGVTRLRDEHEMGWFTRAEYEAAFEKAGLAVRFEDMAPTTRGVYIGTAE